MAINTESYIMKNIVTALVTSLVGAFLATLLTNKGLEVKVEAAEKDRVQMADRLRDVETQVARVTTRQDGMDKKIDDIWQVVVQGRQARPTDIR